MSECRRTVERLGPWADESLPAEDRAEVDRHLSACPRCRTAAESERAGHQILRACAARLRHDPLPPGLRSRCEALAREHGRRPARSWLLPLRSGTPGRGQGERRWVRTLAPVA